MLKRWSPYLRIASLIILAVGTVWLRLAMVDTTYAINKIDKELAQLRQAREKAELKLLEVRSPRRLEALAKQKFKLGLPKAEQVVHLQ